MKGIHHDQPNCIACQNLDWASPRVCAECLKLMKERDEEVEILQLGVGFFADKAVIKRPDGTLTTVSLSELTITD